MFLEAWLPSRPQHRSLPRVTQQQALHSLAARGASLTDSNLFNQQDTGQETSLASSSRQELSRLPQTTHCLHSGSERGHSYQDVLGSANSSKYEEGMHVLTHSLGSCRPHTAPAPPQTKLCRTHSSVGSTQQRLLSPPGCHAHGESADPPPRPIQSCFPSTRLKDLTAALDGGLGESRPPSLTPSRAFSLSLRRSSQRSSTHNGHKCICQVAQGGCGSSLVRTRPG